ncbi:MAG TPA: hypothetical protein VGW75_16350 [Solirubrobacteraceae bacterium]|jgi:hypothetical protein|nr:hypothetical protein [Solirubrobacteraceae bacterium]
MLTISLLALVALVACLFARGLLRRRAAAGRWRVVTRTVEDGRRLVLLAGPGGGERVVAELPATLTGVELETALLDARSKAFGEALRLNELPAGRAPAPRTRS